MINMDFDNLPLPEQFFGQPAFCVLDRFCRITAAVNHG
ncbi:hypothetical protein BSU04_09715 [Caballeronia sordidicola]|uniref:Uncharacterized protein n=1 Tax=Caballeronia sordidicola TaxID=196367 RepID=A0A226X642_CABSO|nr:hypothetical protein BSU04_09715 [Caballeronia sordidicola]